MRSGPAAVIQGQWLLLHLRKTPYGHVIPDRRAARGVVVVPTHFWRGNSKESVRPCDQISMREPIKGSENTEELPETNASGVTPVIAKQFDSNRGSEATLG